MYFIFDVEIPNKNGRLTETCFTAFMILTVLYFT